MEANKNLDNPMLLPLLEEFSGFLAKLQLKQQELKLIHHQRPDSSSATSGPKNNAYLVAYKYHQEIFFNCLREIEELEKNIEDCKKLISALVPTDRHSHKVTVNGETFIMGFVPDHAESSTFILAKYSQKQNVPAPTYLPTYLPQNLPDNS